MGKPIPKHLSTKRDETQDIGQSTFVMREMGRERSMWPLSVSMFFPSTRMCTFLTSENYVSVLPIEPTSISSPVEPPTKFVWSSLLKFTTAVPFFNVTERSFAFFGKMAV